MTTELAVREPDQALATAPANAGLPAPITKSRQLAPARSTNELSQVEKAAIVVIALGPEAASSVLGEMGEQRMRRFAQIVTHMREVPANVVEAVILEFIEALGDKLSLSGGPDQVKKFLGTVLDNDTVSRIMDDLGGDGVSIWTRLGDVEEARLASWLEIEHPQVAAVILTRLNSLKAARVIELFDGDFAQLVVLRMSRVPTFDANTLEQLSNVIETEFLPTVRAEKGNRKPADLIAGLMNHVSSNVRESLLGRMEQEAPALTQEVQRVMFTFADIVDRVKPRDVGVVTKEVDEGILMIALKSAMVAGNPSVEFILNNISKRLAERMADDLKEMPEPSKRDGEAAQSEVITAIKDLVDRGSIKLVESEGGD